MDITATAKYVRLAPSKARDLAGKIRGLPVASALGVVTLNVRKGAFYIGKTLKSAIANAENNGKLPAETLWVKNAVVEDAPRMKRFWASARGSASPIIKRMCHIKIVLSDDRR